MDELDFDFDYLDYLYGEGLEELYHTGTPQNYDFDPNGSGRYREGSGENPYQHDNQYLYIKRLEKQFADEGLSKGDVEKSVADALGITTTQLRKIKTVDRQEMMLMKQDRARQLKDDPHRYSLTKIGEMMAEYNNGVAIPERTVASLLREDQKTRTNQLDEIKDFMREQVKMKGYIDISKGAEREVIISSDKSKEYGVPKTKFDAAITALKNEGYETKEFKVRNSFNRNNLLTVTVIGEPGCNWDVVKDNKLNIKSIGDYETEVEMNALGIKTPECVTTDRIKVNYLEDGGKDRDGLMFVRPGVKDINLGKSNYAQVRIGVTAGDNEKGGYYLKGMAIYGDPKDFPDGVDIIVNSNKSNSSFYKNADGTSTGVPKAFKEMERNKDGTIDWLNPFGSYIKENGQMLYDDPNGIYTNSNGKKASLNKVNLVKEEGDWDKYSKSLAAQFLSKQPRELISRQLNESRKDYQERFDEILTMTNPTVKKMFLKEFADECDTAAVELKAKAVPGQVTKVLIPIPSIPEGKCYTTSYPDGTKLALVRYPHSGPFEIPYLTVDNRSPEAKKVLGNAPDAIGINGSAASQLSGADFDGDTVVCIPCKNGIRVKTAPAIEELLNMDSEMAKYERDYETITEDTKQREMGIITNLIMDMQTLGASYDPDNPDSDELIRAVKFSMVIIDSKKHKLDWQQAKKDYRIDEIHKKWQGKARGGAVTIISRAGGEERVPSRKEGQWVTDPETGAKHLQYFDPETGKKLYTKTNSTYATYVDGLGDPLFWNARTGGLSYKKPRVKYEGDESELIVKTRGSAEYYTTKDGDKLVRNPDTGVLYYKNKFESKPRDYDGDISLIKTTRTESTMVSTHMAETDDAYKLTSGGAKGKSHPTEELYAEFANDMKAMGNKARLAYLSTGKQRVVPGAKAEYVNEVASLNMKLNTAAKNAPKERLAQIYAAETYKDKIRNSKDDLDDEDRTKIQQLALRMGRAIYGAEGKNVRIKINQQEWNAIQAGAVSENVLTQILAKADKEVIKEYAMPKEKKELSQSQINSIKALLANNVPTSEIASRFGVSASYISQIGKES